MSRKLQKSDFKPVNFHVYCADIDGGFLKGGTSAIINLQNSFTVFVDGPNIKCEHPISSFDEGYDIACRALEEK